MSYEVLVNSHLTFSRELTDDEAEALTKLTNKDDDNNNNPWEVTGDSLDGPDEYTSAALESWLDLILETIKPWGLLLDGFAIIRGEDFDHAEIIVVEDNECASNGFDLTDLLLEKMGYERA